MRWRAGMRSGPPPIAWQNGSSARRLVVSKTTLQRLPPNTRSSRTMRITKRSRSRGGFTLIELMIVVGLIGLIAAVAVPNFITYQARARRSEGFAHVAGIAHAYKIYQADKGSYPDMRVETAALGAAASTLPDPAASGMTAPGTVKMPWDTPTDNFFKIVGWRPEGNVYYSYDVVS